MKKYYKYLSNIQTFLLFGLAIVLTLNSYNQRQNCVKFNAQVARTMVNLYEYGYLHGEDDAKRKINTYRLYKMRSRLVEAQLAAIGLKYTH